MIGSLFSNPLSFVIMLLALAVVLTIHEFSHAWAADQLGDPTARLAGRLSLNPFVHFDTIGLLFLLFFGFGWGKPVSFDPYNLKNPRKDAALISLAGPSSNLITALVSAVLIRLINLFDIPLITTIGMVILLPVFSLSLAIGVFNLLPINPLDGFKIVGGILNEEKSREWYQLERYGMIFLLLLILPIGHEPLLYSIMNPIVNFLRNLLLPAGGLGSGIV